MSSRVLIAAVGAGILLAGLFVVTVAGLTAALAATPPARGASGVSAEGTGDIPAPMLDLYHRAAATCPGLDWSVLAAVGKIETDHGRSTLPGVHSGHNAALAAGPMQFLAPTFAAVVAAHPPPPGGASPPSPYNAHDAVHSAAIYLCDSGARATPGHPADLRAALFTYNHSNAYVADVLAQADRYRAATPHPRAATTSTDPGPGRAALAYAQGQLGQPYLWGGDGPDAGEGGFDCSGLTAAAWKSAGATIPRTAHAQYRALTPVPIGQVRAGDLLFFGTPARVHHVAIATGQGTTMIHAPDRGSTVRTAEATALPDLLSAARPS